MSRDRTTRLVAATMALSDRTNQRAMAAAKRAAHPPYRVARIGSLIGGSLGLLLLVAGLIGMATSASWATGALLAGGLTIISNLLNLRRLRAKQR